MKLLLSAFRFFGRIVVVIILSTVSVLFLILVPFLALVMTLWIYVSAVKEMWRSSFARLKKSETEDSLRTVELPRAS